MAKAPAAPAAKAPAAPPAAAPVAAAPAGAAGTAAGGADITCEVVVLGSGPGGYTAAFRSADLGQNTVLVERYASLGGVCLNVGCIPSKALLHAAKVVTEVEEMSHHGIAFGPPQFDVDKLRGWKESVVGKLTKGLVSLAKQRKVTVVQGVGQVRVAEDDAGADRRRPEAHRVRALHHRRRLVGRPHPGASRTTTRGSSTPPARSSSAASRSGCW